jgi:hypothetical protein
MLKKTLCKQQGNDLESVVIVISVLCRIKERFLLFEDCNWLYLDVTQEMHFDLICIYMSV